MSATLRDKLKTRSNRVGEVLRGIALKSGQANGQTIVSGLQITKGGTSNRQFLISAGSVTIAQQLKDIAAVVATSISAGAATGAGQFRKVLIEVDAAGAVSQVVGQVSTVDQASASLPVGDPARISVGWLELPASFTPDTTSLTDQMIVQTTHWASNA